MGILPISLKFDSNGLPMVCDNINGKCISAKKKSKPQTAEKAENKTKPSLLETILHNLFVTKPTLGVTNINCGGTDEDCPGIDKEIGPLNIDAPDMDERGLIPIGSPVTFMLSMDADCLDPSALKVILDTGKFEFDMEYNDPDQIFAKTLTAGVDFYTGPIRARVYQKSEYEKKGTEAKLLLQREIYPTVVPAQDTCPDFYIPGYDIELDRDRYQEIYVNEPVKISFPLEGICNGPENPEAKFILENETVQALKDEKCFYVNYAFSSSGAKYINLQVEGKPLYTSGKGFEIFVHAQGDDPEVPLPSLSIIAPNSASVNTTVNFKVGNPHPDFDYHFDFADGDLNQPTQGTDLDHVFGETGLYAVRLTAIWKNDPSVVFQPYSPHEIIIY